MPSLQTSRLSRPIAIAAGAIICLLSPVANPAAGHDRIQQNGSYVPQAVNRMPDANDQDKMHQQQNDHDRIEAANAQRKLEIAADSEKLLKMVTELKEELDKTNKDTLPVDSIHKIDAIDKLARGMKDKLRLRSN
jgi:acyl carrier protein